MSSECPRIQYNQLRRANVGVESILDLGAMSAVDIRGPICVDAEICIAGVGRMILLDAAETPQGELPLVSYASDGRTCARINRAGTVALMPGEPSYRVAPTATLPTGYSANNFERASGALIPDRPASIVPLEKCWIGSFDTLNIRARPAGQIVGLYYGDAVPALGRTPNWFKIDYRGKIGWVTSHYAIVYGDCG
ncbi:MAG: SH3 domain-containing protein [Chloroflexi bacterium]|nr:SH3 domain-containing protein [Chloroflexota bacterium]